VYPLTFQAVPTYEIHKVSLSFSYRLFIMPLSYDQSTASPKASSAHSAIWCFLCQFTVFYLNLKFIQQLLTYFSSSFRHFYPSLYLSFNKVFEKADPRKM